MKIFQTIQNRSEMLGFHPRIASPNRINVRGLFYLVYMGVFGVSTIRYFVSVPQNFDEYSEAFLGVGVAIGSFGIFSTEIWKAPSIFKLINNYEETIAQREYLKFNTKSKCDRGLNLNIY